MKNVSSNLGSKDRSRTTPLWSYVFSLWYKPELTSLIRDHWLVAANHKGIDFLNQTVYVG